MRQFRLKGAWRLRLRQMPSTVRKQRNERGITPPDTMGTSFASSVIIFDPCHVGCNQTGNPGELIEIRKHDDPRNRTQGPDACQPGWRCNVAPRAARKIEPPFARLLQRQTCGYWKGCNRGGRSGSGCGIGDPPKAAHL